MHQFKLSMSTQVLAAVFADLADAAKQCQRRWVLDWMDANGVGMPIHLQVGAARARAIRALQNAEVAERCMQIDAQMLRNAI